MLTLQAPYPVIQTTTLLPNPLVSDQQSLTDSIKCFQAMDGTLYCYANDTDGVEKLQWPMRLARNKALELRAFFVSYFAAKIRVIDHNGDIWIGNFTDNPFEFTGSERAGGFPGGELVTITLGFQGVKTGTQAPSSNSSPNGNCTPRCCSAPITTTIEGDGGNSVVSYSGVTDDNVAVASPVYFKGTGHVGLAQANDATKAQVAGLCLSIATSTNTATWVTEGSVSRTDWTAITGTALLTPGALYFLDPTLAGALTKTAPITVGQFVVKVGRAESTTDLDIEIEAPIKL